MRFRGKATIKFTNGRIVNSEIITLGDDIETAKKKYIIELYGSYKNPVTKPRVEDLQIISFGPDDALKPDFVFLKSRLLNYSQQAASEIRQVFEAYNPCWDDDHLSDILTDCELGHLQDTAAEYEKYYKLPEGSGMDYLVQNLLNELDQEWVCHYMPDQDLEKQYQKALKM